MSHGETHIQTVSWPTSGGTSLLTSIPASISESLNGEVHVPSTYAGTTLTFQWATSLNNGTYLPIYDTSGEVSLTVAASRIYPLPDDVMHQHSVKFVSDTTTSDPQSVLIVLKTGA